MTRPNVESTDGFKVPIIQVRKVGSEEWYLKCDWGTKSVLNICVWWQRRVYTSCMYTNPSRFNETLSIIEPSLTVCAQYLCNLTVPPSFSSHYHSIPASSTFHSTLELFPLHNRTTEGKKLVTWSGFETCFWIKPTIPQETSSNFLSISFFTPAWEKRLQHGCTSSPGHGYGSRLLQWLI